MLIRIDNEIYRLPGNPIRCPVCGMNYLEVPLHCNTQDETLHIANTMIDHIVRNRWVDVLDDEDEQEELEPNEETFEDHILH